MIEGIDQAKALSDGKQADEADAHDQQRLAAEAVAERAEASAPNRMPTLDITKAVVNSRRRDAPGFRKRRRRHADGAEIEAVEGLHQRAEQHHAQLQCAKRLVFQRLFDRRSQLRRS